MNSFLCDCDAAIVRVSVYVFRLNSKNKFSLSLMQKVLFIVLRLLPRECGVKKLLLTVFKIGIGIGIAIYVAPIPKRCPVTRVSALH